jgi:hypothetical protein
MKIEQRNYGFMHGQIQPFGLLDNPLLYLNSKFQPTSTSKDVNLAFKNFLHWNLSSNPIIQKCITNIEKPNLTHGLCVLSSSIVKEIPTKISTGERFFSRMDVELSFKICHCFLTCTQNFPKFWWCLWHWRINYARQWQPFQDWKIISSKK